MHEGDDVPGAVGQAHAKDAGIERNRIRDGRHEQQQVGKAQRAHFGLHATPERAHDIAGLGGVHGAEIDLGIGRGLFSHLDLDQKAMRVDEPDAVGFGARWRIQQADALRLDPFLHRLEVFLEHREGQNVHLLLLEGLTVK